MNARRVCSRVGQKIITKQRVMFCPTQSLEATTEDATLGL